MELKMTELEGLEGTMNPYEALDNMSYETSSGEKYWEEESQPRKKKVSFNDILSNMNLVVNTQGVLQFMAPAHTHVPSNAVVQEATITPAVKHSYIYNKYFKEYAGQPSPMPEVRVPKTIQEYRQMLADDRKQAMEHKQRIEQIKSKKLMFTTETSVAGINPRNIKPTKNTLRTMRFG